MTHICTLSAWPKKLSLTAWSDLHIEFGALDKDMPGGDILLLAGDILSIRAWHGEKAYKQIKTRCEQFIDSCVRNYDRVYLIFGNHEYYHVDFNTARDKVEPFLSKMGVTILDCESVELSKDVLLYGATFWTSFNNNDFMAKRVAQYQMNDFKCIKGFTVDRAMAEHDRAVQGLDQLCLDNPDKTIVVMSHHAPSMRGINPYHSGNMLDHAYATDLEAFIEARPNIKYWIHGHTHVRAEYDIAQCKVISNARGYIGYESMANSFDPAKKFEVQHVSEQSP